MAFELQAIVGTTLILFVLIGVQGATVPLNQGLLWGLGNRDEGGDSTALQARIGRTVANHIEGMLIFIPLALVAVLADLSSSLTVMGATVYLIGRVMYAPIYMIGIPYLRTLAWTVSVIGVLILGFEVVRATLA